MQPGSDVERHKFLFPMNRPRASDGVPYRQVFVNELAALTVRWQKRGILAG